MGGGQFSLPFIQSKPHSTIWRYRLPSVSFFFLPFFKQLSYFHACSLFYLSSFETCPAG